LSFEQVLNDAYEVTNYVRMKLSKDKIILLGHSWGTVLGSALVQTYPQLFSVYIGVGQAVNMREGEQLAFKMILERAKEAGRNKDIKAIESLAPYPPKFDDGFEKKLMKVVKWQAKYDLAVKPKFRHLLLFLRSPFYTRKEKGYYLKEILSYQEPLLRYLLDDFELRNYGLEYEMPVLYIFGDKDFRTPHTVAKVFYDEISAPIKDFILISNAGHNVMHDNPTEFNRVLLESLYKHLYNERNKHW